MEVIIPSVFAKQLKKYAKKYPRISDDCERFFASISLDGQTHLGQSLYKCRIANSSIPVGKRGGWRCIVYGGDTVCIPLVIYPKNEKETITDAEIEVALGEAMKELL